MALFKGPVPALCFKVSNLAPPVDILMCLLTMFGVLSHSIFDQENISITVVGSVAERSKALV